MTIVLADERAYESLRSLPLEPDSSVFLEEGRPPSASVAGKQLLVIRSERSLRAFEEFCAKLDGLGAFEQALARAPREPGPPAPVEPATTDLVGQVLRGKYRIRRFLGKGGFGSVYEAVDEMLGAPVAVKVLNPALARQPEALDSFLDEAKLLTNLDHPNIVRWITFDRTEEGLYYFVMEFLRGEELSRVLQREGPLDEQRTVRYLLQILAALKAAHRLPDGTSLLHLDLKPQNVFVVQGPPEQAKVIDFGIGQHIGAAPGSGSTLGRLVLSKESERQEADLSQTVVSCLAAPAPEAPPGSEPIKRARGGTLLYASPEQCKHLLGSRDIVALDGRSDLYSLGVMAFQMLSGRTPFERSANPYDAIQAHLHKQPPRLGELKVRVSRALNAFVERCLAKDREERFRDAEEAYEALERIAHPPARWPLAVGALALAAVPVLWWLWPTPPLEPFTVANAPQGRVYLGPRRPAVDLELESFRPLDPGTARIRLVSDPQDGTALLPDWQAGLVGGSDPKLRLEAPADLEGRLDARVYLEVSGEGRSQYSQPLEVVYLGASALSLETFSVPGAGGRVVDPQGAALELALRGHPDDIASVEVALGEERLRATLDATRSGEQHLLYQLPLASFTTLDRDQPRSVTFAVRIQDRAGGVLTGPGGEEQGLAVELDPRALTLAARLENCTRAGPDAFVVYPQAEPLLVVDTNRGARILLVARDLEGNELQLTQRPTEEGIQLGFPRSEDAYSGELEVVVDDAQSVFHQTPARGTAISKLRFDYQPAALQVLPTVMGAKAVQPDGPDGPVVHFVNQPRLTLSLAWDRVPVSLDVSCSDGLGTTLESPTVVLSPQRTYEEVAFELPDDGLYRIGLRGFRIARGQRYEQAEYQQELTVVLDREAPTLGLEGPDEPVLLADGDAEWPLVLRLEQEPAEESSEGPITVRWELRAGASPGLLGSGELSARLLPSAGSASIRLQDLGVDAAQLSDGSYSLSFSATDAAGNTSQQEASFDWEIARTAPTVELVNPGGPRWLASEGNRFPIVIQAADPNGVRSVECTVRCGAASKAVPLARLEGSTRWAGAVELGSSWSEQDALVEVVAEDRYGNREERSSAVLTDRFEVRLPERIGLRLSGNPQAVVGGMCLIQGDSRYTFGGRVQAEEQRTWRDFFGREQEYTQRSVVSEVSVPDFYLDETEVTVAQYLAFLTAADGYGQASHWASGSGREERRLELQRRLSAEPADLPVTGVSLDEACAYAAWVGKRLPSVVEWEYAVRGGDAYRPYSCAQKGQELDLQGFNVDLQVEGGRSAWPVEQGVDVTPEGVRNLCSNVAEWTLADERGQAWAAGASFESIGATAHLFYKVIPRSGETTAPTLGFRCALDARVAEVLLEGLAQARVVARARP